MTGASTGGPRRGDGSTTIIVPTIRPADPYKLSDRGPERTAVDRRPSHQDGRFANHPRDAWASRSIASASCRVPSAAESPRSIAASSSTRPSSSRGVIVVRVRPRSTCLRMTHWRLRVAGHLGQVGHADDLMVPGQLGQRLAQHRAEPAADAGVDLVEDQRRHAVDRRPARS